jgi:hypothetical protein
MREMDFLPREPEAAFLFLWPALKTQSPRTPYLGNVVRLVIEIANIRPRGW